jgi:hypothetical protein
MGQDLNDDGNSDRSEDTGPFAREEELRYQSEHESLGGCDIEHCQRMHE